MAFAVDTFAGIGLAVFLWALARCIAKWIHWHKQVSSDISALQSEQKWQEDRVRSAHARIHELNEKAKVEFKK